MSTKTNTPPGGVPSIKDEWEASEVHEMPETFRGPKTGPLRPPQSNATARAALVKISELSERFDQHSDMDKLQLEQLRNDVGGLREDMRETNRHVGNMREAMGGMTVSLQNIDRTLQNQQQHALVQVEAKTEIEVAETKAEIDVTAHKKKWRRDFALKVVAVAGPLLAALITYLLS